MLSKLRKLDLAIILSAAWTIVCYFFFKHGTFTFFMWLTIILALVRLLGIIRRRLLWKIRNRLIISGLFFIVTPIVLITVFFYLIINIIIYQYNTAIFENLMANDIRSFETSSDYYLGLADEARIKLEVQRYKNRRPPFLRLAFYKETDAGYRAFFTYPEDLPLAAFDANGPLAKFESGYFKINGQLFHGVQRRSNGYAVMIFEALSQEYFNAMPPVGDFKVLFMNAGGNTLSASSDEISARLSDKDFAGFEKYHFPFPFPFRYWDFDDVKDGQPALKLNMFLLINDYSKILQKLKSSDRGRELEKQIQPLEKEIAAASPQGGGEAASNPDATKAQRQKLAELKQEQQLLRQRLSESSSLPIATMVRFMLGLFGFFIVISFIIGFRMVRVITKAVNELTKGTEKIRRGDFSHRIRIKSGEQMHFLAESFNDMASGIGRLLREEKEKERLHEELRIARGIQLKLLPPDRFSCPGFDLAAVNIPAQEIAGDYFDYFYQEDEFLSVLVADVSGKGAQAAFYMAELKGIMNVLQKSGQSPAAILSECHLSMQNSFEKVTFITINLVRFDLKQRQLVFSRSGHTPALFFEAAGKGCRELAPRGMALGLNNFSRERIEEMRLPYHSGDILFFFSDGLSEIMNADEKMLGMASLQALLVAHADLTAVEIKEKILEHAIAFSEKQANADDLTFVVIKVR
ncbi:MAG: SpoIIE family protein phosphatase [Candidatus Aminicenantes bacterium]|nr:SpoIIE family protein phosphatase [Candidatus Aminicenantes bacterium]